MDKQTKEALRKDNNLNTLIKLFEANLLRREMPPRLVKVPDGNRILIIAPHQDDGIIGAGGTIIKAIDKGKSVDCVYITTGAPKNKLELAKIRKSEACKVWKSINGKVPYFINSPNKQIDDFKLLKVHIDKLTKVFKKIRPDTIFVPIFFDPPIDHQMSCYLIWKAERDFGLGFSGQVWSYQVSSMTSPNVIVDITNEESRKYELNRMWKSQNNVYDYARTTRAMNVVNTIYFKGGKLGKFRPKNPYAELFWVTRFEHYMKILGRYYNDCQRP